MPARTLSLRDALGPPVEARGRANEIGAGLQRHTALSLGIFEFINGGEVAIGQRGVGQRPEVFSGLQLGGIGGQEEQVEVLRDPELETAVPASPVQDQHDLLVRTRADLLGKGR